MVTVTSAERHHRKKGEKRDASFIQSLGYWAVKQRAFDFRKRLRRFVSARAFGD
jgi:hypothetical protein